MFTFLLKLWNLSIQLNYSDIKEIEQQIQTQVQDSPITSIPGIPDKILAFAGLSPTTYQSGNFTSSKAKMDKRGSRYLRYKRAEGKHYFVVLSHVAKKLVRIICHLQKTGESFKTFS